MGLATPPTAGANKNAFGRQIRLPVVWAGGRRMGQEGLGKAGREGVLSQLCVNLALSGS